MVFLKLQPYKQVFVARKGVHKFAFKYYSPFRVKDKIGQVAYQLEFSSNVQIHDIFHVSRLKKAHYSTTTLPYSKEVIRRLYRY